MSWLWTLAACIGVCAGTLWACVIHGKLEDARRLREHQRAVLEVIESRSQRNAELLPGAMGYASDGKMRVVGSQG